ncbi:MAG TPA: type II secretion system protein GspG [Lacunisphaera sp.]|jgi:general secretion pathway protein G
MLISFDSRLQFCRRWIATDDCFCANETGNGSHRRWRIGVGMRKSLRGFTLLELLVVIGIVASLCAIVLGLGRRALEAGHIARAQTELAALSSALEEYRRSCGDYPRTADAAQFLQALIGRCGPTGEATSIHGFVEIGKLSVENTADPFIDPGAVLVDPWGDRYVYTYKTLSPWNNASYVLYSIGPDALDSAALLNGGFVNPAPMENADNLYANQPR